ncbi:MAG: GDSL-type esterase/lipase family protein, partial [Lachnospiraceae bacterium]|nr:GDSL-type esterase/lipase family protein [Lachnospiraceae bacterium]
RNVQFYIMSQLIEVNNPKLTYWGRFPKKEAEGKTFVFPVCSVYFSFKGRKLQLRVKNIRSYFRNFLGVVLDGEVIKFEITDFTDGYHEIDIASSLEEKVHEVCIYKCQDACHYFNLGGIILEDDAELMSYSPESDLKLEFYGDSVTAGEVSEAVSYVGQSDPANEGEYSNSYYSYAWMTARKLGARIHDIAQGGIALFDKTGYFYGPDYIGLESVYDKVTYNPGLLPLEDWDFKAYIPDVVVIAFGQNDANPDNYMGKDKEKSERWICGYTDFVVNLASKYPNAKFVLTTTILCHEKAWDDAIEEAKERINEVISKKERRCFHFLYTNNGSGTPGHIRIPEADKMSDELAEAIRRILK